MEKSDYDNVRSFLHESTRKVTEGDIWTLICRKMCFSLLHLRNMILHEEKSNHWGCPFSLARHFQSQGLSSVWPGLSNGDFWLMPLTPKVVQRGAPLILLSFIGFAWLICHWVQRKRWSIWGLEEPSPLCAQLFGSLSHIHKQIPQHIWSFQPPLRARDLLTGRSAQDRNFGLGTIVALCEGFFGFKSTSVELKNDPLVRTHMFCGKGGNR